MLSDVHEGLDFPFGVVDSATIRGKYEFYHYNVDGTDDRVSMSDCKAWFAELTVLRFLWEIKQISLDLELKSCGKIEDESENFVLTK